VQRSGRMQVAAALFALGVASHLAYPTALAGAAPAAELLGADPVAAGARATQSGPGVGQAPVAGALLRSFSRPASAFGPGHRGVDLAGAPGEEVVAALPGTVAFSGVVVGTGWVTVDHGGGLDTTYGPLDPRRVATGQRVDAGEVLGRLAAAASHLDWGARLDGGYIDPLRLLRPWRLHLVAVGAPPPTRPAGADPRLPPPPEIGDGRLAWPVRGRVSSGFGMRVHPLTGRTRAHSGLDVAVAAGTPVGAAAGGRVVRAGRAGGYGLLVVVDHGGGLGTRYAHLSRIEVAVGQVIGAGQRIGRVGSTGAATGPHLHFEVRRGGVAQDPGSWLS